MALIPLSHETHAKTRIRPLASYAFAAQMSMVPLNSAEIVPFSQELPVVLAREGEDFIFVVLTSLAPNRNLLIDDKGHWHSALIPGVWRRGPFRLAAIAGGEDERLVLCIDDASEQISESEGQPLFDQGQPTEFLTRATSLLSGLEADFRNARKICKALNSLGLIVPWNLEIPRADGGKQRIDGLFRVDEAKLGKLGGDDLVALRDMGGLAAIYAHLLSLSKVNVLARISQQFAAREQQRQAVKSNKVDLDRAFGIVEDDPFIF